MARSLRAARLATFGFFTLNGFVLGMWVVHIPVVEHRAGVSHAVLGWLLLLLGAGAFAGMQLVGPLTDRYGARKAVPVSAALCGAALALPGLATNVWTLGAALLVLGFGNGCLDVSMNTHAIQVERGYGRPVMSAFHAFFSVGGVLAALVGARTLSWHWSAPMTLAAVSVFALAVTALAGPLLLRPSAAAAPHDTGQVNTAPHGAEPGNTAPHNDTPPHDTTPHDMGPSGNTAPHTTRPRDQVSRKTPPQIWALAALALMLMLCEGVANDWSVLALRDVLDAPAATAAFAYGAFSTAMTVGRLLTDRVAARFGPVAVVRYGAALGAVGLTAVALSPWIPLALVGWAVFGIGLSGCVPQLFSAAGHADQESAGTNVSRVAGLGYLGMLAGPAIIGPLTHFIPLNLTFFLPVAFCVVAACTAARILQRHNATGNERAPGM
ncbi:MFS transporter [Streptomyces odonnellii]|uniref:MFS transporter n=1 Tax=Streptomyces odonnellii TaxID=1417980 RepID=UPI00062676CE|nr:MFS transporter [Streptomyces odonnellii]